LPKANRKIISDKFIKLYLTRSVNCPVLGCEVSWLRFTKMIVIVCEDTKGTD